MKRNHKLFNTELQKLQISLLENIAKLDHSSVQILRRPLVGLIVFVLLFFGLISILSFLNPSISASPHPEVTLFSVFALIIILVLATKNKTLSPMRMNVVLAISILTFGISTYFNGAYPTLLLPIALVAISFMATPNKALIANILIMGISIVGIFLEPTISLKITSRAFISNLGILILLQLTTRQYQVIHSTTKKISDELAELLETFRKYFEKKLSETELVTDWVMSSSGEGYWDWDIKSGTLSHNRNWYELLGYSKSDFKNHIDDFEKILHPDDRDIVMKRVGDAIASKGTYTSEHRLLHKNGQTIWVLDKGKVVDYDEGEIPNRMIGSFTNITHLKDTEATIRKLAYYDPLTNLPNRRLLEEKIPGYLKAFARHDRSCLFLILDLDDFKLLNDTRGHASGDELLKIISKRIQGSIRSEDFAARLGGDEFVILLSNFSIDKDNILKNTISSIEKLIKTLSEECKLKDTSIVYKPAITIGATVLTESNLTMNQLLKEADIALYKAKEHSKGNYALFDDGMQADVNRRVLMLNELQQAVKEKGFKSLYQPIVDPLGIVHGYEVLSRWHSSSLGEISPIEYIPLLEDLGLIETFTSNIVNESIAILSEWKDTCCQNLTLSINVTPEVLNNDSFSNFLISSLEHYKVSPSKLIFEITESKLATSVGTTIQQINKLSKSGIVFALDDFGTGFSSLSRLKELTVHSIKIDKSFVDGIVDNADTQTIVKATIRMAKAMGLDIVGEGVETKEQAEKLVKLGCDRLQGYLFSKPIELTSILKVCAENSNDLNCIQQFDVIPVLNDFNIEKYSYPLSSTSSASQFSQSIPVGTYVMRLEKPGEIAHFTFISKRFAQMFDIDRKKVLNDPNVLFQLVHPDDIQNLISHSKDVHENTLPFYWEGRMVINNKIRWFISEALPRKLDDGSVVWEGASTEITKQKQVEQLLITRQQELLSFLDNTPYPLATNSLTDDSITYINKSFIDLFGYTHEQIPSVTDWAILAYPDKLYRKEVFDWWYKAVENFKLKQIPIPRKILKITAKNGEILDIVISGNILNDQLILSFINIPMDQSRK